MTFSQLLPVLLFLLQETLSNPLSPSPKSKRDHRQPLNRTYSYVSSELNSSVTSIAISSSLTSTLDPSHDTQTFQNLTHLSNLDKTALFNISHDQDQQSRSNNNSSQDACLELNVTLDEKFVGSLSEAQYSSSLSSAYTNLIFESSGNTFFDDWDFFTDPDPTHGLVEYQSEESARKAGLISIGPNTLCDIKNPRKTSSQIKDGDDSDDDDDGCPLTARMQVDSTNWLKWNEPRKSVRITSKLQFKCGLLILDAIKMPFGCSTWPAFWTLGDDWPNKGEVDIVEGINLVTKNRMTLHTAPGCFLNKNMSGNATGKVFALNCDAKLNYNTGCPVDDLDPESYGKEFNKMGGGVFVMEWKPNTGIGIWRFNRFEIPLDLLNKKPNPSSWKKSPVAFWDVKQCSALRDQFSQQKIIFDITVCGDWAGSPKVWESTGCFSNNSEASVGGYINCTEAVRDPTNFIDAQWEIASVQLYQ